MGKCPAQDGALLSRHEMPPRHRKISQPFARHTLERIGPALRLFDFAMGGRIELDQLARRVTFLAGSRLVAE